MKCIGDPDQMLLLVYKRYNVHMLRFLHVVQNRSQLTCSFQTVGFLLLLDCTKATFHSTSANSEQCHSVNLLLHQLPIKCTQLPSKELDKAAFWWLTAVITVE